MTDIETAFLLPLQPYLEWLVVVLVFLSVYLLLQGFIRKKNTRSLRLTVEEQDRNLRKSSRDLQTLLDHMMFPVLILNRKNLSVEYANPSAFDFFAVGSVGALNEMFDVSADNKARSLFFTETPSVPIDKMDTDGLARYEVDVDASGDQPSWQQITLNPLGFHGQDCILLSILDISQRKRADAQNERRIRVLTTMASMTSQRSLEKTLDQIIAMVSANSPKIYCGIMQANLEGTHLHWISGSKIPSAFKKSVNSLNVAYGNASCGTAASLRSRYVSKDIRSDPNWANYRQAAESSGLKACWSEPILSSTGCLLGTFAIYHDSVWEPEEFDLDILTEPLFLASLAMEDAQTRAQLNHSLASEQMIREVSTSLLHHNEQNTQAKVLKVLESISEFFGFGCAYIYLQEETNKPVKRLYQWFSSPSHDTCINSNTLDYESLNSLWKRLSANGYCVFGLGATEDDCLPSSLIKPKADCSTLFIPLYNSDLLIGLLGFETVEYAAPISQTNLNTLLVIASIISNAFAREALVNALAYKAFRDHLTGLFNRHKIQDSLKQEVLRADRYETAFSLILFDIDHFKQVNDTYGHNAGDDVLQAVAALLKKEMRSSDIVGRWGGEEFLILLPETDINGASKAAEHLRKVVEGYDFPIPRQVTISLGVAQFKQQDTPEFLVNRADEGLYKAKEAGRNAVQITD